MNPWVVITVSIDVEPPQCRVTITAPELYPLTQTVPLEPTDSLQDAKRKALYGVNALWHEWFDQTVAGNAEQGKRDGTQRGLLSYES